MSRHQEKIHETHKTVRKALGVKRKPKTHTHNHYVRHLSSNSMFTLDSNVSTVLRAKLIFGEVF